MALFVLGDTHLSLGGSKPMDVFPGWNGYVIRLDYSDVKAMTAELQKIGTNINQIAKRVNATGTLYAQDIEDIKGAMAEIWQLQRSILSKAP